MKDYISRDVAINHILDLAERWVMLYGRWDPPCARDYADEIDRVPAADVAPVVKAKWELDSDKLPICSNCGEIALQRIFVNVPHLIQDVRMVMSNFCPNCGASMKEVSK